MKPVGRHGVVDRGARRWRGRGYRAETMASTGISRRRAALSGALSHTASRGRPQLPGVGD